MSAINIIQRVARKLLTQNQPKGVITIPNRMTAEAKAGEIAATLQRAGLSMNRFDDFITSETDLIRLLNQIEAFEKNNLADNIRSGIRNTESAKVFDLKGKQIKNTDNIMGGEAMETEAEIAARLQKQNKDSVQKILERKNREDVYGLEDYDTTNMSEIKKEIIRTETKLGNLNPNTPGFRERAKPLIDKIEALKNKMRDDKADGGIMRLGFKDGMNRRTFLKFLAGAASIPIVGKILKPFKIGKTVTKVPIIKTDNVAGKPEWFDQLVNKVILEGDDVTKRFATKEREIVHAKQIDEDKIKY